MISNQAAPDRNPPNDALPSEAVPLELRLAENRRVLTVSWEDGAVSRLAAPLLRRHSRSASAVRAEVDGRTPQDDEVTLTGVHAIGAYAVQLSFSDGHDRGIYPWRFLRAIADGTA